MIRLLVMSLLLASTPAFATIQTKAVAYNAGPDKMEGFMAWDDTVAKPKGAILIVDDWMGLSEHTKAKAQELAKMGYIAFGADIYGIGKNPKDGEAAGVLAKQYKDNRTLLRAHVRAAYDKLLAQKNVDAKRIVAIGYCFGGTTALELARSGAPLMGTAVFHAGLGTPHPETSRISSPLLVMHGADDPYVPVAEVAAFKKEMKDNNIQYTFLSYPGAVHSFTIQGAGTDNSKGAAYNAQADKKSWEDFNKFLLKL